MPNFQVMLLCANSTCVTSSVHISAKRRKKNKYLEIYLVLASVSTIECYFSSVFLKNTAYTTSSMFFVGDKQIINVGL